VTSTTGADGIRDEFTRALEKGDANIAELIALDAIAEGAERRRPLRRRHRARARRGGPSWETGRMSIADEHLATGIAYDVMKLLGPHRDALPAPLARAHPARRGRTREPRHGLRMIGDLAEGAGFDVRYLGAAVPRRHARPPSWSSTRPRSSACR
jgi:methanogenic corrinoid protein MtbC1